MVSGDEKPDVSFPFPFSGCTFGEILPGIYLHATGSYRRRFRSLLVGPLSVKRYYFPLFVDSTQTLQASFRLKLQFTLRLRCNCAHVSVFMFSQLRSPRTMSGLDSKLMLSYACTILVSPRVPETDCCHWANYATGGFFCFVFVLFWECTFCGVM